MDNNPTKKTFDRLYDRYAPLCYGLALDKLGSEPAAQAVLQAVISKLADRLEESNLASEANQSDVCKIAQLEITSYKKKWVLSDMFFCRAKLSGLS